MKTERLTILLTAAEKAELSSRADAMGISASELVRLAVRHYDPEVDEQELRELVDELAAATRQARDQSNMGASWRRSTPSRFMRRP